MNPNPTDREQLLQKVRNTPKQVFWSVYLSLLLGVLLAGRAIVLQVTAGTYSGKSLLFTALTVGFFAFNGLGLLSRNKLSYVLLAVFALLPAPGSLVGAVQLLALLATGEFATRASDTIVSIFGLLQLLVIAGLFVSLLSTTTRVYVWPTAAQGGAAQQAPAEKDTE